MIDNDLPFQSKMIVVKLNVKEEILPSKYNPGNFGGYNPKC
jgi:hypothetical protein